MTIPSVRDELPGLATRAVPRTGLRSIARRTTPGQGDHRPVLRRTATVQAVQHLTVIPDAIGVGTIEVGSKRFALLSMPVRDSDMHLDVVMSFADAAAVSAECDRIRSEEMAGR